MSKKFLLIIVFLVSCTRSTDLSTHPDYVHYIGKEYKTKLDLAVVMNADNKKRYVLYFPGKDGIPKVEELKSFPFEDYDRTIFGILPAGSIMRVNKIEKTKSIEWNMVDFYVVVESSGPFQGQTVFALMLTDMDTKPAKLNPKYIEELSR